MKGFIEVIQRAYEDPYLRGYTIKSRKVLVAVNHITQVIEPEVEVNKETGDTIESFTGCNIYTSDGNENVIGAEQSYDEIVKLIEEAVL